jgi:hypothetical protein
MKSATNQDQSTKTVLVCSVGNVSHFSRAHLTRVSPVILKVAGGEQLLRELASIRPIGVLLVLEDPQLVDGKSWLRQLEQKIMFEGLRVVIAIKNNGANPVRVFSSRVAGQFHLAQCLGVRDFLSFDDTTTDQDMSLMIDRIRFAFGLSSENPFEGHFRFLAASEEPVEISVPARISHIDQGVQVVLESGVFLNPGTRLSVRLMGLGVEAPDIGATMLENLPSGLRFNFGNSLLIRLDEEGEGPLLALLARELPGKVFDRPIRRAMVVTRSLSLRQNVISALGLWQIEARVPLVRRNIRGDLPPLKPDFLIIEPSVLAGRSHVEGAAEVDELLQLAGPQCRAIVVGRRTDWNFQPSDRFAVVRDSANLAEDLRSCVDQSAKVPALVDGRGLAAGRPESRWFATDAQGAKVLLVLRDQSASLSEEGMELETSQAFRLWSNVEVRGLESKAHFIGRVTRVLRIEDAFRSLLRLGGREQPVFRCQIASTSASPALQRTFRSLALVAQAGNQIMPARVVASTPIQRPAVVNDLAIRPDRAEDFGRKPQAAEHQDQRGRRARHLVFLVVFVAVLALLVLLAVVLGSSDQVYGESFERLFDVMGGRRAEP